LNIDFFDGITAIIGPNESGKSTLIEAILFALYGQKSVSSLQYLVNFESNKASITFNFQFKEKKFRILRELTKSKSGKVSQSKCEFLEVYDDDSKFTLAIDPSNVDPLIESTIGFRYNELVHSNIISQKKLDKISELTPAQWTKLFNEFLNLKGFGSAVVELKEKKSKLNTSLETAIIMMEQLQEKVIDYWDRYEGLKRRSIEKLQKSHLIRSKRKSIEKYNKFLSIINEFIEKKNLKENLKTQKEHQIELLSEKETQLNKIELLEKENEILIKELKEFDGIDLDDENLLEIKNIFEDYITTYQEVMQLQKKLDHLNKLEEKLNLVNEEFKNYENTPTQLSIFRKVDENYTNLSLNYDKRDTNQATLENIESLENRNSNLKEKLDVYEKNLEFREEYDKAVSIFDKFKARLDQIRSDRNKIKEMEFEHKQVQKKCPKNTPNSINSIKEMKKEYENMVSGFTSIIFKTSKYNLPSLLLFGLLAVIFLSLRFNLLSILSLSLLIVIIIKIIVVYLRNQRFIANLERLLFLINEIEERNAKISDAILFLEEKYKKINQIILSLPKFYSESFSPQINLDDQEYHLNLYFQTLDSEINSVLTKHQQILDELEENQKLINKKPIVQAELKKTLNSIEEIVKQLDKLFKDFHVKYYRGSVNEVYKSQEVNFLKIKTTLNNILNLIKTDLDKFNELNSEITTLEEELEQKPPTLEKLKEKSLKKQSFFEDIFKLVKEMSGRYLEIIGGDSIIKTQIEGIKLFKDSLNLISKKLNKDKNERNDLRARWNANNEIIKVKPELLAEIGNINNQIEEIKMTLQSIKFPIIPNEIELKFDAEEPESCKKVLENQIYSLEEIKNKLDGEISELNKKRKEIREFLINKEHLNEDFFIKKQEIERLEWDIDIHKKSINSIEKVNKEIWDMQMPYITSNIRKFLPKITMGRYRVLNIERPKSGRKKRYEFKVLEENSQSFIDKELLSGGTEDQVLLAIRVAFAMSLLPQSKGDYPRFLFLDESFASSDHDRRIEILNWLKTDLSSIFYQIIIISHQQHIINNIPFHYKLLNGKIAEKVIP